MVTRIGLLCFRWIHKGLFGLGRAKLALLDVPQSILMDNVAPPQPPKIDFAIELRHCNFINTPLMLNK